MRATASGRPSRSAGLGVAAPTRRGEPRAGREPPEGGARPGSAGRDGRARGDRAGARRALLRRVRVRGGALAQGGAAADARHPVRGDRRGARGARRGRRAGRQRREAAQVEGLGVVGAATFAEVVGFLEGTWSPRATPHAKRSAGGAPVDLRGGPRPAAGPPGARGGGGRRPQRADGRIARGGQDDARAAAPHDPAHALARGGARGDAAPFRRRPAGRAAACSRSRPFRAPPFGLDRRRCWVAAPRHPAPGRGLARPPRRALPRRAHRVPPRCDRGLRQPLEDGRVVVTRAVGSVEFPARFTLVAAANPCPCGFDGDPSGDAAVEPDRVELYRQKLSGPLLDRIDLRLRVPRLTKPSSWAPSRVRASAFVRDSGRGGPRPPARRWYAASACRATPICPGRSRAARLRLSPDAEDSSAGRSTPRAHGSWVRPCAEGRPDDRRPRGRRPWSRPTTWPRRSRTATASRGGSSARGAERGHADVPHRRRVAAGPRGSAAATNAERSWCCLRSAGSPPRSRCSSRWERGTAAALPRGDPRRPAGSDERPRRSRAGRIPTPSPAGRDRGAPVRHSRRRSRVPDSRSFRSCTIRRSGCSSDGRLAGS